MIGTAARSRPEPAKNARPDMIRPPPPDLPDRPGTEASFTGCAPA